MDWITVTTLGVSITGQVPGLNMLVVEIPDSGGIANLHNAINAMTQHPVVLIAAEDTLFGPTVLDQPSEANNPSQAGNHTPGSSNTMLSVAIVRAF